MRCGVVWLPMITLLAAGLALTSIACTGPVVSRAEDGAARASTTSAADNASRPGEPVAEPATFHSLGVRWPVLGDANADATIDIRYRARGETAWRQGLPLFRTAPGSLSEENRVA